MRANGDASQTLRWLVNGQVQYGYDGLGNLALVTWQDQKFRQYHYEDARYPAALTGITDELGVRIGTYTYDATGRVASTERAAGADRLTLSYNGFSSGFNTVNDSTTPYRTYSFSNTAGVLRGTGWGSPIPGEGAAEKSAVYDTSGNKTKAVAFDGTTTFTAYDNKGRPTERATFPASFQTATTRPALSNATRVVSTQWHATWNLPLQQAEPNRITAYTYDAKGNLTGLSTSATTDNTGATKFTALKTGSTTATGWGYDARSLNTTVVETVGGVTQSSRTATFDALGNLKTLSHTEAGVTSTATITTDAHGRLTAVSASNGASAQLGWTNRGHLSSATLPGYSVTMTIDARGLPVQYLFSTGDKLVVTYDANGEPLTVTRNTNPPQQVVMGLPGLMESNNAPTTALASLERWLRSMATQLPPLSLPLSAAHAQVPPPPPPMPSWVVRALGQYSLMPGAAAATSAAADFNADRPPVCCGSALSEPLDLRSSLPPALTAMLLMQSAANAAAQAINDEILLLRSTYRLRANMCKDDGRTKPLIGCWHAHHIVAVAHPRAKPARDVLEKDGIKIDINNAVNGMWVRCEQHSRLRTHAYYDKVNARLEGLTTAPQVIAALIQIRIEIDMGIF